MARGEPGKWLMLTSATARCSTRTHVRASVSSAAMSHGELPLAARFLQHRAARKHHPSERLLARAVLKVPQVSRLEQHPPHLPAVDRAAHLEQPAAVLHQRSFSHHRLQIGVRQLGLGALDEACHRLRHHLQRIGRGVGRARSPQQLLVIATLQRGLQHGH
eukprot:1863409-Prymnesium_polylepis.1